MTLNLNWTKCPDPEWIKEGEEQARTRMGGTSPAFAVGTIMMMADCREVGAELFARLMAFELKDGEREAFFSSAGVDFTLQEEAKYLAKWDGMTANVSNVPRTKWCSRMGVRFPKAAWDKWIAMYDAAVEVLQAQRARERAAFADLMELEGDEA